MDGYFNKPKEELPASKQLLRYRFPLVEEQKLNK
jgi:hypothetical protein